MKTNNLAQLPVFHNHSTGYLLSDIGDSFCSPMQLSSTGVPRGSHQQKPAKPAGFPAGIGAGKEYLERAEPTSPLHFVKKFSSSSGLKSRTRPNILRFFRTFGASWRLTFLGRSTTHLAELMRRTLAPLRRILSRNLEVYEFRRNSVHPQSFAVHDHLECGHVHTSLLWDIFDLLNAYTESPHVRAKRHRCQECLTLVQRKPVVSVAAVAKAA